MQLIVARAYRSADSVGVTISVGNRCTLRSVLSPSEMSDMSESSQTVAAGHARMRDEAHAKLIADWHNAALLVCLCCGQPAFPRQRSNLTADTSHRRRRSVEAEQCRAEETGVQVLQTSDEDGCSACAVRELQWRASGTAAGRRAQAAQQDSTGPAQADCHSDGSTSTTDSC
jgi:hypothetical protein